MKIFSMLLGLALAVAHAEVALPTLQGQIWPVVEQAHKTTVAVGAMGATGSGVVVTADGIVLTAGHVVTNMETGEVAETVSIQFDDGEEFQAEVLGMNRSHDAAMLQLIGEGPWAFSPLGSSAAIRPGTWVVATGHPSGYDALRAAPVRFGRVVSKSADHFFGSDCVLFGGDSGGPLFDLEGKVVGIHSWIGEDVQTNTHAGISGFVGDWEKMKAGDQWGKLEPPPSLKEGTPVLGVMFNGNARGRSVRLDAVLAESAAEVAGLREGDLILRVDGEPVDGARFKRYLQRLQAGDEVVLDVQRGQEELITRVQLGTVTALPFVTQRGQDLLETQAREFFGAFEEVTDELGNGVVRVFANAKQVGFGTVWNGTKVLAKWSEIKKAKALTGVDSDGREFALQVLEIFAAHDLVLLKMPAGVELRSIPLQGIPARAGTLVAAVRPDGVAEGIGVISVAERSLLVSSRGFLGVELDIDYDAGGVLVRSVENSSAAEEAGVLAEDVISAVDGRKIDSFQELRTVLSRAGANQEVVLSVRRRTGPLELTAKLKPKRPDGISLSRRERMMNRMDERGLSDVRDRFPSVLQTDMTISPEETGLPVVDSDGRLVGIVLARAGRVKTFLLPVSAIAGLVEN
ncbi:MAG: trypsin-like peptidase domain-containing protein [Roseibacillus sp.]